MYGRHCAVVLRVICGAPLSHRDPVTIGTGIPMPVGEAKKFFSALLLERVFPCGVLHFAVGEAG